MSKFSNILRILAEELEHNESQTIRSIHQLYIQPLQESQILTNSEVARRLRISRAQVTKLIAQGKIPTTPDGRVSEFNLWQYITNEKENQNQSHAN